MSDSKTIEDFNALDAILVSKQFAPAYHIEILASVVQEMFKNTDVIYGDDDTPTECRDCEEMCKLKEDWIKVLILIKNNWKEKDFVYVTDMGIAVLIRKIDILDLEWKYMVLTLLNNIGEGVFGHGTINDMSEDVRTIPYDMKILRKKLKEKDFNLERP